MHFVCVLQWGTANVESGLDNQQSCKIICNDSNCQAWGIKSGSTFRLAIPGILPSDYHFSHFWVHCIIILLFDSKIFCSHFSNRGGCWKFTPTRALATARHLHLLRHWSRTVHQQQTCCFLSAFVHPHYHTSVSLQSLKYQLSYKLRHLLPSLASHAVFSTRNVEKVRIVVLHILNSSISHTACFTRVSRRLTRTALMQSTFLHVFTDGIQRQQHSGLTRKVLNSVLLLAV